MSSIGRETWHLIGVVFSILIAASLLSFALRTFLRKDANAAVFTNIQERIQAWWVMCSILTAAILGGKYVSVSLFAVISILAVREIGRLVELRPNDSRALIWIYFVVIPVQYFLVAIEWYGLFSILIPVYIFLFIPFRLVINGDTKDFFARVAKLQFTVMVGVYLLSHAPALFSLHIPNYQPVVHLLFFLLLISQLGDVMQFVWGKLLGRHKLAPLVSPGKTWEGFIGGGLSILLIGALLSPYLPFNKLAATALAGVVFLMGVAGGLILSAIKRDSGRKDWGELVKGHGGVMDRIDSVVFSAPIFFHLVRYFYSISDK